MAEHPAVKVEGIDEGNASSTGTAAQKETDVGHLQDFSLDASDEEIVRIKSSDNHVFKVHRVQLSALSSVFRSGKAKKGKA